jgi:AhpD family alkylhydroperoxidase
MNEKARFNLFDSETAAKVAKRINNAALILEQSALSKSTQNLVMLRASQINGCGFCTDIHTKEATAAGETPLRLSLVAAWRETTVFTQAERAALALTEEATRLSDASPGVSDETWHQVRAHYDDDRLGALMSVIALINASNRLARMAGNKGGSYERGMFEAAVN